MKGFILTIVALILFILIAPIGILYQSIRHLADIGNYFFRIAISIDQAGNVVCAKLFNDLLITKRGFLFGNPDELISSVLGKNKGRKSLTLLGRGLAYFLNKVDKNHVEKSIEV